MNDERFIDDGWCMFDIHMYDGFILWTMDGHSWLIVLNKWVILKIGKPQVIQYYSFAVVNHHKPSILGVQSLRHLQMVTWFGR